MVSPPLCRLPPSTPPPGLGQGGSNHAAHLNGRFQYLPNKILTFLSLCLRYRGLEVRESQQLPSIVDCDYPKAVALGGVSKALSAPGLRIGWLLSHDEALLDKVCGLHDYTAICSSALSEVVALALLRQRTAVLAANRCRVKEHLVLLRAFFERHSDTFAWREPRAGTVCFPRLLKRAHLQGAPSDDARPLDGSDALAYAEWLVKEHGILLAPAPMFDSDLPCFRVGFGRKNLPDVLERWEATLLAGAN